MKAVSNTRDEVASPIPIRPAVKRFAAVRRFIDTHWRAAMPWLAMSASAVAVRSGPRRPTRSRVFPFCSRGRKRIVGMRGLIDFDFNVGE